MTRLMQATLGVAAAAVFTLAASSVHADDWRPDAWITTKAKIALATSDDVSAMNVNVDTVNGRVTLHGKVPTEAERTKAASAVKSIEGVTEVENLLQVVPESRRERVTKADEEIRKAVSKALADDPNLTGSDIEVQSVNDGVVLLSGDADSLFDHLAAVRTAASVPGVQRVASEVTTNDKLYDDDELAELSGEIASQTENGAARVKKGAKEAAQGVKEGGEYAWKKTKEAAQATGAAAQSAGEATSSGLRDAWITAATKTRLLADPDTPALDINVDTRDGEVTLFGVVSSQEVKRQAEENAREVSGVKSIRNELVVNSEIVMKEGAERVQQTDETVKKNVESALDRREQLREADIDVSVASGTVRLTGSVPSEALSTSAATIARAVQGVKSVKNELRVEQRQASVR